MGRLCFRLSYRVSPFPISFTELRVFECVSAGFRLMLLSELCFVLYVEFAFESSSVVPS